tara:strand:- start:3288 stop:4484 length:1197 start_codon:yes stop_codon:yes gene_type:complete
MVIMNKIKSFLSNTAVFNLGFRIFFLGAALYSIVAILFWTGIYSLNISLPITGLSLFQWHAHEMVYGYSLAVIAGFLLTAVKNWTAIQTVHGLPLAAIFCLWLIARLLFLFGTTFIYIAAVFDLLFIIAVFIAVVIPIIQAKNWKQLGILSKLVLLAVFNSFFYLGYAGVLEQGLTWGIYGGLYLVIGLILTLGGRVIPFFTEGGVGYKVKLYSPKWTTLSGLLLFVIFFVSELFLHNKNITGVASAGLFVVYSIRLVGWYTPGIWKKPLLWSLHIAMLFINVGFLLFALNAFADISKFIAIHALAYGGIGIITLAMMARVALGHTGGNVNVPVATVKYVFATIILGAICRVFFPMFLPEQYLMWIISSQVLWIAAFLLFVITYAPILTKPRIDGQFG